MLMMTLAEIRLVKHLVTKAKEIGPICLRDWDTFRQLVMRHAEPQALKDMRDKQIERCLLAAWAEVTR
jgi:hypothetical protein